MRGGGKKDLKLTTTTQKRGKQDRGRDADICKCSDTDLEKASSSGWLVNRGVKLPCGSQSMGKSPAHWFNLYISVINVYCSSKPGDYWKFLFLCFLISSCFLFHSEGLNPFEFGVMKTKHNFSRSWRYTIGIKLHSWLSWRVTTYSCWFQLSVALYSSWKPLWHHKKL